MVMENFLVTNETQRPFFFNIQERVKELLDLPKGSENKNLSPSSGFRRTKLYFAKPYYNVVFQYTNGSSPLKLTDSESPFEV